MNKALLFLSMAAVLEGQSKVIALPGKSPIVTFRIVFRTGAAADSKGKEGVASLTASMLSNGGTKSMTYQQILDAFYPIAARVGDNTDKEMITFTAATHVDNLDAFKAPRFAQEGFLSVIVQIGPLDESLPEAVVGPARQGQGHCQRRG